MEFGVITRFKAYRIGEALEVVSYQALTPEGELGKTWKPLPCRAEWPVTAGLLDLEEVLLVDRETIPAQNPVIEDDISLMDLLGVLLRRRKIVAFTMIGVTSAVLAYSFVAPKQYKATATLMPIDSKKGFYGLDMPEGGLGGLIAAQAGAGMSSTAKLVTILESRSMAEEVIRKLNLMPLLFEDRWDEARQSWKPTLLQSLLGRRDATPTMLEGGRMLGSWLSASEEKQNLVSVSVKTPDPKLSAAIVNTFVRELETYLQRNALSSAKRNRRFVETQLSDVQNELAQHELSLKRFQEKHSLVSLDSQAEAAINTYATLKAQLIAKEVQLEVVDHAGSFEDVQASALRQEVASLKSQLKELESGKGSGALISLKDAPELGRQYVQIKRNLLVKQKVYELLVQQFEMAKIEEAKEDLSFQVLDPAVPPDEPAEVKKPLLILIALAASAMLGALLAFGVEYWARNRQRFGALLQQPERLS